MISIWCSYVTCKIALIIIYRDKIPLIKHLEPNFLTTVAFCYHTYSWRSRYLMTVYFIRGFFTAWWHSAAPHYFYMFTTLQELSTWQPLHAIHVHIIMQ